MQYTIQLGSSCNCQVSQGSVETSKVKWIILMMCVHKISSRIWQ